MRRTGKAAPAKYTGAHTKVPAIFLNHHVSSQFACAKDAVFGLVDAHRFVDAVPAPRVTCVELPALFGFVQRQAIRRIAVNLIGRCMDKYRIRRKPPGGFKYHQRTRSVDRKIRRRLAYGPVMTRLGSTMDYEFDILS